MGQDDNSADGGKESIWSDFDHILKANSRDPSNDLLVDIDKVTRAIKLWQWYKYCETIIFLKMAKKIYTNCSNP